MTLTAPIANVLQRVKNVVQDNHAKLRDALAEVGRLQAELETIQHEIASRTDISRFDQHVRQAEARHEQDRTNFGLEFAYRVAVLVRDKEAERIRPLLAIQMRSDGSEAMGELFKRNPDWREVLRAACEAKLAIVQHEAREIEQAVRKELASENFSEQAIARHPKLVRTRNAVRLWKSLREQCSTESDTVGLWKRCLGNLISVA